MVVEVRVAEKEGEVPVVEARAAVERGVAAKEAAEQVEEALEVVDQGEVTEV